MDISTREKFEEAVELAKTSKPAFAVLLVELHACARGRQRAAGKTLKTYWPKARWGDMFWWVGRMAQARMDLPYVDKYPEDEPHEYIRVRTMLRTIEVLGTNVTERRKFMRTLFFPNGQRRH